MENYSCIDHLTQWFLIIIGLNISLIFVDASLNGPMQIPLNTYLITQIQLPYHRYIGCILLYEYMHVMYSIKLKTLMFSVFNRKVYIENMYTGI